MKIALNKLFIIMSLLYLQGHLFAQEKPDVKFGKISPADFDLSNHSFDTSAGAVYISDIGSTVFDGGRNGWFTITYTRHVRIKILNKNGFDAASFIVQLYRNEDDEETLEKLKAATYNLEEGKVVTTKLEDRSVINDKLTENVHAKKFTLPAVREGSVIEVQYSIRSGFTENLQPWVFQGKYPRLWSEYTAAIPDVLGYIILTQGYRKFDIQTQQEQVKTFWISKEIKAVGRNFTTLETGVMVHRWVMKDVPPIEEERYITTLNNYIAKVEFQLSELRKPLTPRNYLSDWNTASKELMQSEHFGQSLNIPQPWLEEQIKSIVAGATTSLEKAKKIYAFVRDNFTCTDYDHYQTENPLKRVFTGRKGSVAEINLLLIAMLQHQGITAQPILLSTRDHGYTHNFYPLLDRFNYVIAGVNINEQDYYLDATERRLGFAYLPLRCYNGHARTIDTAYPNPVFLVADSVKERKLTNVQIGAASMLTSTLGYYESMDIRGQVAQKGMDELQKNIQSQYPAETTISQLRLDSLNDLEVPIRITYTIGLKGFTEDIVYFNPMLAEGTKDNYFKSARRHYPVEMPFAINELYTLDMEIPAGYVVDALPEAARVNLNTADGSFDYSVKERNGRIMLRSHIQLNRAYFHPSQYEALRSFFDQVVKKHAEVIVFRKKK